MTDTSRAYFDTVFGMTGEPGRRAREYAGKVREDVRTGAEKLRENLSSGSEQVRGHGSRTLTDIGRLVRAEMDAGLARMGVATQSDLEDVNLRLEVAEEEIRDLRVRLAAAESRAAETPAAPAATTDEPTDEESA
ncbi:hypothetical protein [Glycomyces buryatensis]|uniref:Uncharacterized protein n=1 Tax=Glycomyces buryatensis TaxID=2570927 RepID=A0A4V4HSD5_9ACTN|nr:hypothetical protein [Glycomyces buryatensis]THV41356.1 hypothetical protein FAB82_11835 [Glycomyces buryatensis]